MMLNRYYLLSLSLPWTTTTLASALPPDPSSNSHRPPPHHHPWCKPTHDSAAWPSPSTWQRLNDSISGRLVAPTPPGAVCHPSQPTYNNATCAEVAGQWSNTSFHAMDLVSADYNDVACLPDSAYPCSRDAYPRFVVPAVDADDVRKAVSFAREKGVRLVVKGTGHDAPGRSSASDSLSIQTHKIRGLELNREDSRAHALGGIGSLKIYAGERMVDVYRFAADNNITAIGGADPHVGIGGWISHGGHGPVTAYYGTGSDQVLEMEVVTADGVLRTVNETEEADLFWALRGGGASNFAVIVSVTMKVYESIPYTAFSFSYNTTAQSDTFWSMVAYFHSQVPRLVKGGLMGYFWATPIDAAERNSSIAGKLYGEWLAPKLASPEVRELLEPIEEYLQAGHWNDQVFAFSDGREHPGYNKGFPLTNDPDTAGIPVRLGSRLLDEKALSKPLTELADTLRRASDESAGWPILGHVIAGPGTWSPKGGVAGGSNAVLPAWRKACMQIALPRSWDPLNQTQKEDITTDLREKAVQGLRELAPDTGAYVNEADPTEPDWQRTFYGENYGRLLALKKKWDPRGVFWYKNSVGSELWEPRGPHGVENGVGQNPVQLCRI